MDCLKPLPIGNVHPASCQHRSMHGVAASGGAGARGGGRGGCYQVMVECSVWYSADTAKCWAPHAMCLMVHPVSPSKGRGYLQCQQRCDDLWDPHMPLAQGRQQQKSGGHAVSWKVNLTWCCRR